MGKRVWNKGFFKGKYQLAEHYASKGRLKDYALLLTLKSKYRNSTYKNFSLNKLSNQLGVSYYYLKAALERLEKDGALRYEYGHLVLVKQKRISDSLGVDYLVNFELDCRKFKVGDTLSQIRRILVASSHNRIKWRNGRVLLSDNNSRGGLTDHSDTWYEPFSKNYIQISYKGLARLWGCSVGTAFNQIKKWVKDKEMKKECCNVVLDVDPWVVTEAAEQGDYSFFINEVGGVTKVMPNKYYFNV